MTTHITDHQAQALARLAQQYKGKANIEKLISVLVGRLQPIEDALWQLLTERWIDTAVGAQLDLLGRILRQPRGTSVDDAEYRQRLRARIRINRSSGTVEQLLSVFVALGIPVEHLWLEPTFPAGLVLHVEDYVVTDALATLYASFLKEARLGAVGAYFHSSQALDEDTFALASSTTLRAAFNQSGGIYPSSMPVASTKSFPDKGSVFLRYSVSAQQKRFSYTSKTLTTFEGVTAQEGSTNNFASGELVVGAPQPETTLTNDFEGEPFPTSMTVVSTEGFPDAGILFLGYGLAEEFRGFLYSSKTPTSFEGVVADDLGVGVVFSADTLVVNGRQGLSDEDFATLGGKLSSVKAA